MPASIVVVGYHHPAWLARYCRQLHAYEPELEIIIVDVDPILPLEVLELGLYQATGPLSYAQAVNLGLRQATGDLLLWSNDDIMLHGRFLALLEPIIRNQKSLVGPVIRQQYHRDYLEGFLVAMDRDALRDIGYLDEQFPGCFEDVDYSWRATAAGYRLVEHPLLPLSHIDYGRLDHQVGESHRLFRAKWGV